MSKITSLHHVTATVADAQQDLDFYVGLLGLRLLKRTVNFDNPNVFHFYYGDERGSPSTIMTTFPYSGWGVPKGSTGAGQIESVGFSLPAGSLLFWKERFDAGGVGYGERATAFGETALSVADPSGLAIELIEGTTADPRVPWLPDGISREAAIRGVHHVRLSVRQPDRSARFLSDVLGLEAVRESSGSVRMGAGGSAPGHLLDLVPSGSRADARNGLGTVHHVALAVPGDEEQLAFRERLLGMGWPVTEVRDRQYFRSIYFREPGGVLLEIATAGPGFDVDEPVSALGEGLKLPPWEESNRASIEAALPRVSVPGAAGSGTP